MLILSGTISSMHGILLKHRQQKTFIVELHLVDYKPK